MIGMTAGMMAVVGAVLNGSEAAGFWFNQQIAKAAGIPAAFAVLKRSGSPGKTAGLAGHRGVALLNDAHLRRLSGADFRAHSSVGRADDS